MREAPKAPVLANRHTRPLEEGFLSYVEVHGRPEVAWVVGKKVVVLAEGPEAWSFFQGATLEEVRRLAKEEEEWI